MQLKVLACYVCYAKFILENYELWARGGEEEEETAVTSCETLVKDHSQWESFLTRTSNNSFCR